MNKVTKILTPDFLYDSEFHELFIIGKDSDDPDKPIIIKIPNATMDTDHYADGYTPYDKTEEDSNKPSVRVNFKICPKEYFEMRDKE